MKIITLSTIILLSVFGSISKSQAQNSSFKDKVFEPGQFVLKGKIKNPKQKYFEFAITSYLPLNSLQAAELKPDGTFEKSFPIVNTQQLYLYLNDDAVAITVAKNDTIQFNWDDRDFINTFQISSEKATRNNVLNAEWQLYKTFYASDIELQGALYEKEDLKDQQKFELINEAYNKKTRFILALGENIDFFNLDYLLVNSYFNYVELLRDHKIITRYSLTLTTDSSFKIPIIKGSVNGNQQNLPLHQTMSGYSSHKTSNENWLLTSPNYRRFLLNYLRFESPINSFQGYYGNNFFSTAPKNRTFDNYYRAKAHLGSLLMEEWFITNCLILDFDYGAFKDVDEVYNFYLPKAEIPYFKTELQKKYELAKNVKPGLPAPNFSLLNEKGNTVSLADFKGKVVYIDFWGVNCGPCLQDINLCEKGLHRSYENKDVVFVNICVDSDTKQWKKAIKAHQITGVNLIAEGWSNNPVCKTYGVSGIPHYVIINKDGTIANNNAPMMRELLMQIGQNELDEALKK